MPQDLVFNEKIINPANIVSTNLENEIIEALPDPLNIWEHLKQKSDYDDVEIDEQTLK